MKLRMKYENGHFIPLEAVEDIAEGSEFEVVVAVETVSDQQAILKNLEETAGLWADIDGIEEFLADARQQWEKAWQDKLRSL